MHEALARTFQFLAKTDNDAALHVLIPSLDAEDQEIQDAALSALLRRRGMGGGNEVLCRLNRLSDRQKDVVRDHPGRITRALRDAIHGDDPLLFDAACRAAVLFHEYDLAANLLGAIEKGDPATSDQATQTLGSLASMLYDELAFVGVGRAQRDPQAFRRNMVSALETSLQRFSAHKRREVLEYFLWLVNRDNLTLKTILQSPHHAAFLLTVDILSKSLHGGIVRLLLSFLDDPRAPSSAISVAANRADPKFVRHLLKKIGREPTTVVAQNLKKIELITWLRQKAAVFEQLDDAAQHAAVRMVMASSIPRSQAFDTISFLLTRGKPGGRREAARAMADFSGAEANAQCVRALEDADPQVQANVLMHIRQRGIPGILPRLVEMVDSPHAVVRQAARQCLAEFTFARFVGAFDMLDDEVRRSTGLLVKKTDPQTLPQLKKELESAIRTKRLRGIQMAICMALVEPLEKLIIELLHDEDHLVRVAAVQALSMCSTSSARLAVTDALNDRSVTVQDEARRSLEQNNEFSQWRELLADPRD